jgi:hypothetical protein
MKIKHTFTLLILVFVYTQITIAQEKISYNPFTNEEFSYKTFYKEVKDLELNNENDIEIDYFAMRNSHGRYFDRINAYIAKLALEEWKSKEKKFALNNEVKSYTALLNDFKNRSNTYYNKEKKYTIFDLKSIEIEFISVCNDKITFKQSYKYSLSSRYDNATVATLEHYFVADINTEKVVELKHQFNDIAIAKLDKVIAPYIQEFANSRRYNSSSYNNYNYNYDDVAVETTYDAEAEEVPPVVEDVTSMPVQDQEGDFENGSSSSNFRNKPREEGYETEKELTTPVISDYNARGGRVEASNPRKNTDVKIDKINYNEANYYWYAWGLMVQFPAYTKSTSFNNGLSFTVFVPFYNAKSILELIPEYASFSSLSQPIHQFNNFNYFEITSSYARFRQEPTVTSLFTLNNAHEKPKKLTLASYQLFESGKKNYRGNYVYEFDESAKNFQQMAAKTEYTSFNEKEGERLKMKSTGNNKSKEVLKFDDKNNLIFKKIDPKNSEYNYHYFYNESFCYNFKISSNKIESLDKISLKSGEICLAEMCLSFNKNFKVDAIKKIKNHYSDMEVGFDEKERVIEAHSENDRYNYYFEYDAQDRLVRYSYNEYQKLKKEVMFYYLENKKLPYLQKKRTLEGKIFEEETYDWEY